MEPARATRVNVKMLFRYRDEVLYYSVGKLHDFPGGGVEYGETLIDALRRELKEEIGHEMTETPEQVGVVDYVPEDGHAHHVIIGYSLELPKRQQFTFFDESKYPRSDIVFTWVKKADIDRVGFFPNHETLARKALERQ